MNELISNQYLQLLVLIISIYPLVTFFLFIIKRLRLLYQNHENSNLLKNQKDYYKELDSDAFIKWRNAQLKKIYKDPKYFTTILGVEYPVFEIPFKEHFKYHDFKEKNIYDKEDIPFFKYEIINGEVVFPPLEELPIVTSGTEKEVQLKHKLLRDYSRILKGSIYYPNLIGFSLDHYDFDSNGRITHIYPKLGIYMYNVYTSHILEFELFEAYKKFNHKEDISLTELWGLLPFRHYIHFGEDKTESINAVLTSGIRRYSLLSVQCIVVFKDHKKKDYNVLLMKRATNPLKVSAKLGYYQFFPAGGFELYEKQDIHTVEMIKENYSLRKAIFREYLEEVFGFNDFKAVNPNTNEETTYNILNNQKIIDILDMIDEGKASLNLLGIGVDLVSLRHEISFVLRIDDERYSMEKFCPNDEFTRDSSEASRIRIPLNEVERILSGEKGFVEKPKINQASALLYHMFKNSEFYPINR